MQSSNKGLIWHLKKKINYCIDYAGSLSHFKVPVCL